MQALPGLVKGLSGGGLSQSLASGGGLSKLFGGGFGESSLFEGGGVETPLPNAGRGISKILSEGVQLPESFGGGNLKSNVNLGQIQQNVTPQIGGANEFEELFRQFITGGF